MRCKLVGIAGGGIAQGSTSHNLRLLVLHYLFNKFNIPEHENPTHLLVTLRVQGPK